MLSHSNSFVHRPLELLHHIFSFINRPQDLLSLALTCRLLSQVLIPHHIQFRLLRYGIRRADLWKKLLEYPALNTSFTSVEIISESEADDEIGDIIFPTSLLGEQAHADGVASCCPKLPNKYATDGSISYTARCTELASLAIQTMGGLTSFHWFDSTIQPPRNLLASLRDCCPLLEDIWVIRNDRCEDLGDVHCTSNSTLWDFSNLSSFSFCDEQSDFGTTDPSGFMLPLFTMLTKRCPNLRCLRLSLSSHPAVEVALLLQEGRWPRLSKLEIEHSESLYFLLQTFLTQHPTLEYLSFIEKAESYKALVEMPPISPPNLPNLRSLRVGSLRTGAPNISAFISPELVRNLQFLSVVRIDANNDNLRFIAQMPNLRSLVIVCVHHSPEILESIAHAIPLIEKIAFSGVPSWMSFQRSDFHTGHRQFEAFCKFLNVLRHLTHFSYLDICSSDGDDDSREDSIECFVHLFATISQQLRYIEIGHYFRRWVAIERKQDGSYESWYYVTRGVKGLKVSEWGGYSC